MKRIIYSSLLLSSFSFAQTPAIFHGMLEQTLQNKHFTSWRRPAAKMVPLIRAEICAAVDEKLSEEALNAEYLRILEISDSPSDASETFALLVNTAKAKALTLKQADALFFNLLKAEKSTYFNSETRNSFEFMLHHHAHFSYSSLISAYAKLLKVENTPSDAKSDLELITFIAKKEARLDEYTETFMRILELEGGANYTVKAHELFMKIYLH